MICGSLDTGLMSFQCIGAVFLLGRFLVYNYLGGIIYNGECKTCSFWTDGKFEEQKHLCVDTHCYLYTLYYIIVSHLS